MKSIPELNNVADTNLRKVVLEVCGKHGIRGAGDSNYQVKVVNSLQVLSLAVGAALESGDVDLKKIRGLKVLDLACGSTDYARASGVNESLESEMSRGMEPWFCRTASAAGANVTGVDILWPRYLPQRLSTREKRVMEKRGEKPGNALKKGFPEAGWNFVQRNLLTPGALDQATFPTGSYDVVWSTYFIENTLQGANDPSILGLKHFDPELYRFVVENIRAQVLRVLKPGGLFLLNYSTSRKVGNELVKIQDSILTR